jgi:hypothetical protein
MTRTEPFDRELPSPIGQVLELRARSEGAVVSAGGFSDLQRAAFVASPIEGELARLADEGVHDLFVVTGSAGGGKTALLERVLETHGDRFGNVVLDATHADRPDLTQAQQLSDFLAPFANGIGRPERAKPALLAANTGMLLELFRQLRRSEPGRFTALEELLKCRLGISRDSEPDTGLRVAVFNLDHRPTAGDGGMTIEMLRRLDFDAADGIVGGAPRCSTCRVRDWCPVRSNAAIASGSGAAAIDRVAAQAALERGRHDSPRQLWDWFSRLITADDSYDAYEDPCDAVVAAASHSNRKWVWDRLLARSLFSCGGEIGERVRGLDPSVRPSADGHQLLASAGISAKTDAAVLGRLDLVRAPAVARSQEYIHEMAHHDRPAPWRIDLGRALVYSEFLRTPDNWPLGGTDEEAFRALLSEYGRFSSDREAGEDYEALSQLPGLLEAALASAFGIDHHGQFFIPIKAYDPRDPSRIFVQLRLEQGDSYALLADPVVQADADGAECVGHRALALSVELGAQISGPSAAVTGGIDVAITLPMYRLLRRASAGTLASTADLERFYGLRRAVEALARAAATTATELLVERPGTERRYMVSRSRDLRGPVVRAREVVA